MGEALNFLWYYLKKRIKLLIAGLLLSIIVTSLAMVNPYIIGVIVDEVIYGGIKERLFVFIAIMLVVTVLKVGLRYLYQIIFEIISQGVVFDIRKDLYQKLQDLDFEFYDSNKIGELMSRLTGDIDAIRHFIAWVVYQLFNNLLSFTFALIMMFSINATLTFSLLAITPLIFIVAVKLTKKVKVTFSYIRDQYSRLNTVVQENISGNRVVKAFAKEDYEVEKFDIENNGFKERNLDSARVWGKYIPILDSLSICISVIMLFVGGLLCFNNKMTVGELVIINGYLWAINGPLRMSGWLINDIQRFNASYDKLKTIIYAQPKIKNPEIKVHKNINGLVTFKNVTFKYGEEVILKNINFTAHAGQTIAIIGATGSGKTSLVNLICRFYDCEEGMVMVDGVNIKEYDLKELRSKISVAMQDIFLFSDTLEGNIAYGSPDASMEEVIRASKMAGVEEFINKFSDGYDTVIGERGVGLSGGQKQRIALARAIIKDPSILILDDTTSSLDMETEFNIFKNLKEINNNRTTFIIAHRISSVKDADLILVLDKGEIIEKGNHKKLMNKKGHYYNTFKNQLGDFDSDLMKEVI